ncbi:unnamed protein product [Brassicogethes aeneus]|uniref:Hexosyltransferase n=1 Tax=Brassicogethes aeneus TaxID=1431903 RepID=A0A9P0ATD2_BRAAE|nr:unnamed protein product [Brassicogethes aeneus]
MMLEKRLYNPLFLLLALILCVTIIFYVFRKKPERILAYKLHSSNSSYTYPIHNLPKDDYNRLIDLNFTFKIINYPCNDSNPPLLLVLVHTSPDNHVKRSTIRDTWGKNDNEVKVLFVIGDTNNTSTQNQVLEENLQYGDLIQGDYMDAYRNMTYKHVMILKYAIYHCPLAKYILKTDDDVFVHIRGMKHFLSNNLSLLGASNVLFCTTREHTIALRSYRSKWRVTFKEFPDKYYPTYCPGWNLLYSPDVIFNLYEEAQQADYFWIDDVHITGILAKKLNIVHTNIQPLVVSSQNLYYIEKSYNITQPFLYGPYNLNENTIRTLWKYANTHPTPNYTGWEDFN